MTWILIILAALLLLPSHSEHRKIDQRFYPPAPVITPHTPIDQEEENEPIKQLQDEKRKRRLFPRLLRKTRRTQITSKSKNTGRIR